jgi:PAS domain S-box-containing protein
MNGAIAQAGQSGTEVHAEQVRMLYEGAPTAALVNTLNGAILAFLLWDVMPHSSLQGWLAVMCLVQALRLALTRLYQSARCPPQPERGRIDAGLLRWFASPNTRWDQRYLAGVAASGLVWGVAGFWLFPPQATIHQLALSFVLGGTVAGATAVLAPLRWAFPLFALPALLPLSARFFLEGTAHYLMMGTLVLIFLLALLNIARLIHSTIASSIRLRLENRELVAALTVKADDLRKLNRLLKTEIHEHAQATDQFRDRSFFLQQMIDAIPNPVFHKSLDGVYQGCNEAMARFFGVSKAGFAGKTVFDMMPRESAEEHAREDRELLRRGGVHAYETDVIGAGGARRRVLVHKTVLRDPLDRPIGVLGTLVDLTDRGKSGAR